MRIKLEMVFDMSEMSDDYEKPTKEERIEYMKQTLFEVCEDWVLRGQEPDLEIRAGR